MIERPLILVSNDDGIEAPGLKILVDCVKDIGDVIVVAPALPQSGQSSAMTVNSPLRIKEHPEYNGAKMYSVSGTPVDCIKLSMNRIVPRRPSLVLSGINHGTNAGNNVLYSGTMGAAMEGAMVGIPSAGYSLLSHSMNADFSHTMKWITLITEDLLKNGMPYRTCLNVNFPLDEVRGLKVVRAALSHWTEEYVEYKDPHGKPFYWLTDEIINEEPGDEGTDLYWLEKGYASVVPTRVEQSATEIFYDIKSRLEND